jgi:hypothetical protein
MGGDGQASILTMYRAPTSSIDARCPSNGISLVAFSICAASLGAAPGLPVHLNADQFWRRADIHAPPSPASTPSNNTVRPERVKGPHFLSRWIEGEPFDTLRGNGF